MHAARPIRLIIAKIGTGQCISPVYVALFNPFCAIFSTMPEYVIEREIPGAGQWNEDQIREASTQSLEVLREMGAQIQWLHSYVTDDKIYWVYLAPDETLIRAHARQLGVPANRISAVRRMIDPAKYA